MAGLRNPASACTRLFICQAESGTVNRLRAVSPITWQQELCGCGYREAGTVHQVYQTHTNSKSPPQPDKKEKEKKLSYFETVKEQVKNVEKMKDGIISSLSNSAISTAVMPGRVLESVQKNLSFINRVRNKMMSDINSVSETINYQVAEFKKFERKLKGKNTSKNDTSPAGSKDNHSFQDFMKDANQSIASFYDTSTAVEKIQPKQHEADAAKEEEDDQTTKPAVSKELKSEVERKKSIAKKDFVSKGAIETRTRALVHAIKLASSTASKYTRTEELCNHLLQYPDSRNAALKEKVLHSLLRFVKSSDKSLSAIAREALALVGYVGPVRGQGIKLLSIDGGGTKGLVVIECLKKLEQLCGQSINEMFDYVCGVSTGALIAALIFLYRVPLDECEQLYKEFSRQMFTRNKILGTSKLVWNHAFYDELVWEKILKNEIGDKKMIEFSKTAGSPKMSALSCLMNTPRMRMFFFRNYNLPPGVNSEYLGSCNTAMWEVIRASTAAPFYFESFVLGDLVHQDGGLLANNGTALAIHESKLLWPDVPFQCVISLGTGQHLPSLEYSSTKLALKDKVMKIVDSATDTEAVHMTLQDLLPHSTYFRFNPYLCEDILLDEIREEKLVQMQQDTRLYLRKNEIKVNKAVNQLMRKRRFDQKVGDYIKSFKDTYL